MFFSRQVVLTKKGYKTKTTKTKKGLAGGIKDIFKKIIPAPSPKKSTAKQRPVIKKRPKKLKERR